MSFVHCRSIIPRLWSSPNQTAMRLPSWAPSVCILRSIRTALFAPGRTLERISRNHSIQPCRNLLGKRPESPIDHKHFPDRQTVSARAAVMARAMTARSVVSIPTVPAENCGPPLVRLQALFRGSKRLFLRTDTTGTSYPCRSTVIAVSLEILGKHGRVCPSELKKLITQRPSPRWSVPGAHSALAERSSALPRALLVRHHFHVRRTARMISFSESESAKSFFSCRIGLAQEPHHLCFGRP